jgi:multiple sugar transport system permease protein
MAPQTSGVKAPAQAKSHPSAHLKGLGRHLTSYLFLLPYLLAMLLFSIGPGLYALLISFADFSTGIPRYFAAGLNNYITAYTDFRFVEVFQNVGIFLIISVPLGIGLVVLLSLLLHIQRGWLASSLRTIYFVPGAVTGPALVLLAIFMFDPNISPFRGLLRTMGYELINDVITPSALPWLFTIIGFFAGAGVWIAIFYGAYEGLSTEVMEAATIDGCNAWQKAWYIKIPLIKPYIMYMLILVLAGNVQLFAEPQLLGVAGGNVPNPWSPNQLSYYFAFRLANFGAAAAASLVMLLIGLAASYVVVEWTGVFKLESSN